MLAPALAPLAAYRQFVVVLFVPKPDRPGKTDKYPLHPTTGAAVDAHDPAHWLSHDEAEARAVAWGAAWGQPVGVGFVLTEADPFWCLDLDGAAEGGQWKPQTLALCARLPGTAIEVSNSGTGVHVWGSGGMAGIQHRKKNAALSAEFYTSKRFIALGTSGATGHITDVPASIVQSFVAEFFAKTAESHAYEDEGPREDWSGPTDDAELIRRAMRSHSTRAMFGGGASFADLWEANAEVLGKAYPDSGGRAYDASSADAALAQHLSFWTGCDVPRIERLMRQSALAREKWDHHDAYLVEFTIRNACARQRDVLKDKPVETGPADSALAAVLSQETADAPQQKRVEGTTFLGVAQQQELFKGCVYVVDQHKVLIPRGLLLKEGQFKSLYGGYTFAMDERNERTTRNAWEAFTESQALRPPRADGTCFKPQLAPAAIINEGGRTLANIWWPVDVPCVPGDPQPLLTHLAKLLPDARDQRIMLSYMAACVQYPGVKFQWAPLLQGVEGNGKSFLSAVVAEAIGRRYVHWPKAKKITAQFNAWLFGNLFYAVEDIHTPDGSDVIEDLKPMITSTYGIEIEAKGVDQASRDICGNFIFNSNHKNGLRKTANDRRFAVFYCAQQHAEDLTRDGMGSDYMRALYDWAKAGGFAVLTHFLKTWAIPDEFNPAKNCQRAPYTSSTTEALANGLGRIEQEILEAIQEGRPGFAGGWVSSMALARMLEGMGRAGALPLIRRREVMQSLGYDWHPHLVNGRVHNAVLPDNGKTTLFIMKGSPDALLTEPSAIAKAYTSAQAPAGSK